MWAVFALWLLAVLFIWALVRGASSNDPADGIT